MENFKFSIYIFFQNTVIFASSFQRYWQLWTTYNISVLKYIHPSSSEKKYFWLRFLIFQIYTWKLLISTHTVCFLFSFTWNVIIKTVSRAYVRSNFDLTHIKKWHTPSIIANLQTGKIFKISDKKDNSSDEHLYSIIKFWISFWTVVHKKRRFDC